ncbi:MAG: hypothetical protein JO027_03205 [Solirubrobacterales bacterium]|nr:hypothetical protein [Solirubrobacterales bacterium]
MSVPYEQAVHAQAENLRASRAVVERQLAALDLGRWSGGHLALVGMGASYNALRGVVPALRAAGIHAELLSASEFCDGGAQRLVDAVLAVSQSGRSAETVAALEAAAGLPKLVVTGDAAAPVAERGDAVVELGLMQDSAIYTLGFTATLQALGLLADALGEGELSASWDAVPKVLESVLRDASEFAEEVADALEDVRAIDVIANGPQLASAAEAGLLLREACRIPSAVYETRQYLHGPMEPLAPGMALVAFGSGREYRIAVQAAEIGATAVLLSTTELTDAAGLYVHRLPVLSGIALATLAVVPAQLIVGALAGRRGLAIDGFRYEQPDVKV